MIGAALLLPPPLARTILAQSTPQPQAAPAATFARRGMIASNSELASTAGIEVLRQGGNAVDAAVATGFALAVVYPQAGNLGGGGYMLIRMADGRTAALDYREVAPLSATRDMYVAPDGKVTAGSTVGYRASGVPGAVAGLYAAQRRYGRLPLSVVMRPAIRLASDGFIVDSATNRSIAGDSALIARFSGRSVFLPGGAPPPVGSRFRQPALAATLRLIARGGERAFYRGSVATTLAADMRANGGNITRADMARYRPVWRTPIVTDFRGFTLLTMPPSSSGGVTVGESLNIVASFPAVPPFGSAEYLHRLASAYQRAFVDRNSRLGDPAFVPVPLGELTSKRYAARLAAGIGSSHTPTAILTRATGESGESSETTHYSVVDAVGNAVSTTTTLNGLYGSGVYIASAGFFMNNEMDDFTVQPGTPNMFGLVMDTRNAIAPGKRMLSSMSPTIVLDSARRLLLVVGARGGPRIITATSQVILNVVANRMTLAQAMRAPRVHHQALPDTLYAEPGAISAPVLDSLTAMGYAVKPTPGVAKVDAVVRVPGGYEGMDDPRNGARAVGY